MKIFKISLAWQILIALFLGSILGVVLHNNPEKRLLVINHFLSPAGDIFTHLIKMIVVPIVISTLIIGIASVSDTKQLGRIGIKTIIYFEIVTTLAIIVGIALANFFKPGSGIDMSLLKMVDISKYQNSAMQMQNISHDFMHIILSLIPQNIFFSIAHNDMLQIIFFSVLFGLGLSSLPLQDRKPLINIFKSTSATMFKITNIIMCYSPIGVFSLIALTISNFGFSSFIPLAKLVVLVYLSIFFFAFIILGAIARICNFKITVLIRILKNELILAYSTSSSETVLPQIIQKMQDYGAPKSITSFVVPTGYSFNLDGSTLYQSIAAIFIAQLYGIELSLSDQIILVLTLMITSKGIAGIPGISFVVLLATLGSVGIPLEGLAFIAGVDRIMDMARTALNVIGNSLAVLVISRWENQFDDIKSKKYEYKILNNIIDN
ncbi:glutamate/aspartate:proton symporter GltP [Buchnera aphidicola (Mollitrichosiphum nigrofasciatum)]|uniref:glutamate/aspartate:proton symporter GltP n=1 Tax=Buchnera aphidicola TaxID=9 RepID=UPI0031B849C8